MVESMPFEMNRLYNLDCEKAIKRIPDKFFDLAVADPPYGIKVFSQDNSSRSRLAKAKDYKSYAGGDSAAPGPEYFAELKRISKNQVIFGANHFIENLAEGMGGINSPCWIVWDKENGKNDFADCELAYTSFPSAVRIFRFRWAGMLQGNMKEKEARIHPTQKPVALYNWIYANYAKRGQKVIDTHFGSASSMIAAKRNGLEYMGFELDPDYYAAAVKRFKAETAQISIFDFMGG